MNKIPHQRRTTPTSTATRNKQTKKNNACFFAASHLTILVINQPFEAGTTILPSGLIPGQPPNLVYQNKQTNNIPPHQTTAIKVPRANNCIRVRADTNLKAS